jgi:nicotinamide phosphoribosyltransferase
MKINPLFLIDFYKAGHRQQYPEGTSLVYSNFTPRSNKYAYKDSKEVVVFGIQYLIIEYLIYLWNNNFFFRDKDDVVTEYKSLMDMSLGKDAIPVDHIEALHDLQYLPIEIKALPEGSLCPIGVPMLTIKNTKTEFFWLTNYLETLMSNILWKPMTSATTAYMYRKEFERHAELTGSPKDPIGFQGHDFSMRGMSGIEDAVLSGMGHLISFRGTDTVPAIVKAMEYYPTKDFIGGSVPATEHSVMCMGGDGVGEFETFKRLITETYPSGFVSIVSDTWDFWKVITEYLPRLKEEILARDGRVVIRPDSGDPADIICGINSSKQLDSKILNFEELRATNNKKHLRWFGNSVISKDEFIGAYELLWDIFGGTINEKGYKVLNPKVGLIYGDSINYDRQRDILSRLEAKKFAASNLVLGIGSFTYEFVTRDTYGFAMKATYGEVLEEIPESIAEYPHSWTPKSIGKEIYKDPKTDDGLKKSAKGLLQVKNGVLKDQCTWAEEKDSDLQTVFRNGYLYKKYSLTEVRENLWGKS